MSSRSRVPVVLAFAVALSVGASAGMSAAAETDTADTGAPAVTGAPAGALSGHTDRVAISAKLSATTVSYGSKVTVTGTVSYEPGGKFVPLPGQTVRIYDRAGAPAPVATAVTDSKGGFAASLPKEAASLRWVLRAGGGRFPGTATDTLPMKVSLPTAVSGFQAALNQYWQVSFHGCLALAAGVPGSIPSPAGLTIQYAASPGGPWHELGTVAARAGAPCGHGGRTFSGALPARLNSGYYRAVYAGGTDPAGTGYLRSAGGNALAWKYEDRITSFSVSKPTAPKGGKLTVTGRVQYYSSGAWRNHPGQQVLVILRPKGSASWYWIARPTTDSGGQFSATFTDPVSADWSAEYLGDPSHLATMAATSYVRAG